MSTPAYLPTNIAPINIGNLSSRPVLSFPEELRQIIAKSLINPVDQHNDDINQIDNNQPKTTLMGVDLSNPYQLASFLLTQLNIRSGSSYLWGWATVPTTNTQNINHSLINWDKTINVLNAALIHAQDNPIEPNDIEKSLLTQSFDHRAQIVQDDLHRSHFFLNDNQCIFYCPGLDINKMLPRQSMLHWIKNNAHVKHDDIMSKSEEHKISEELLRLSVKTHVEKLTQEIKSKSGAIGIAA
jgi:hypothetical protein